MIRFAEDEPSSGVSVADGRGSSIRPVRSAQDVREMIAALLHEPTWLRTVSGRLAEQRRGDDESEVWVDGDGGVLAAHIVHGVLNDPDADGSETPVVVLEVAHRGRTNRRFAQDVVAEAQGWGKRRGATAMLFSTGRRGPWERLLRGFRQVSVTYLKRI